MDDSRVFARWAERLQGLDGVLGPVVACSGGADSTALLVLCAVLELDPIAVHVDHGLRSGSAADAGVVRAAAERLGVRFDGRSVLIAPGANLEARARDARYRALEEARADHGAPAVLVAHTADDQAETVLLNLLRGSAARGLGGMRARRGTVIRPLLGFRRADAVEVCAIAGIAPLHDSMNDDERFRRVWLRREVVPHLERAADRDVVAVLARQADVLREEADLLDEMGADLLGRAGVPPRASTLAAAPRALARRALRLWLGEPPPDLRATDEVLAVAAGGRRSAMLPGGRIIERSGDRLAVTYARTATAPLPPPESARLPLPGRAIAVGTEIEAWVSSAPPVEWPDGRAVCVVDAERAGTEAVLRAIRADDRFRPLGLGGSKRAVRALAERGVARAARDRHAVVAAGDGAAIPAGEPLWLVGYGVVDRVRVTRSTRRYLWLAARAEDATSPPDTPS
jgi:tRNA(Ile)-lysidine synthase